MACQLRPLVRCLKHFYPFIQCRFDLGLQSARFASTSVRYRAMSILFLDTKMSIAVDFKVEPHNVIVKTSQWFAPLRDRTPWQPNILRRTSLPTRTVH